MSYCSPPEGISASTCASARRWRWLERVVTAAAGSVLIVLLVIAARLTPSRDGLGTHRQLGLPPCTVLDWFGVRCPSCGMTTSWACLVGGQPMAALRANAGGALLAIVAAVCGPWLLGSGMCGRWVMGPPREWAVLATGLTIVVVTLIQWTVRIAMGW